MEDTYSYDLASYGGELDSASYGGEIDLTGDSVTNSDSTVSYGEVVDSASYGGDLDSASYGGDVNLTGDTATDSGSTITDSDSTVTNSDSTVSYGEVVDSASYGGDLDSASYGGDVDLTGDTATDSDSTVTEPTTAEPVNSTYTTIQIGEFTGSDIEATLTLTEENGTIRVTASVAEGYIGDLRGLFFHVGDESLLSSLAIAGEHVTGTQISANAVGDLGKGNNINPGGLFDFGVDLGTPGISKDDLSTVTFTITSSERALTLADFVNANLNGDDFGIRITSVGDNRSGSSKLVGEIPAPEIPVDNGATDPMDPTDETSDPTNGGVLLEDGVANTPGFWKQKQHFQHWSEYSPSDSFKETFGVNVEPPKGDTLLNALKADGGGNNTLFRAGTTGLLNATSDEAGSGINYVIDNDGLAIAVGETGADLESVKATLSLVDLNADLKIGVSEVKSAVRDAFTAGGVFEGKAGVQQVALAFDTMNNYPSLELENF